MGLCSSQYLAIPLTSSIAKHSPVETCADIYTLKLSTLSFRHNIHLVSTLI